MTDRQKAAVIKQVHRVQHAVAMLGAMVAAYGAGAHVRMGVEATDRPIDSLIRDIEADR